MIKVMGLAAAALAVSGLTAVMTCSPADAQRPAAAPAAMQTASIHAPAYRVTEKAARRIAWRSGVDHIEDLVLVDERWEVAGRDRSGNEVAVDIHAHDGRILRHLPPPGN
ncbi:hypothetical protein ABIE41_002544 [Bosea sp. OAE506]|uniref:hypothetical protein n=1 Tax=Bosea sp. OAE506 TaxID=2663870 RepID=UPI00178B3AA1